MDLTEEIREEMKMAGNKKRSEIKTGYDSTETEKPEKTISKNRSEPSSDKPNLKDMKITLTVPKSDEKYFRACLDYHTKMTKLLRIKTKENTRTFSHCKSSNSRSR